MRWGLGFQRVVGGSVSPSFTDRNGIGNVFHGGFSLVCLSAEH
jgi:hypothetical protein